MNPELKRFFTKESHAEITNEQRDFRFFHGVFGEIKAFSHYQQLQSKRNAYFVRYSTTETFTGIQVPLHEDYIGFLGTHTHISRFVGNELRTSILCAIEKTNTSEQIVFAMEDDQYYFKQYAILRPSQQLQTVNWNEEATTYFPRAVDAILKKASEIILPT